MDPSARADHAKRLLEDPLLVEALDQIEKTAIEAWKSTAIAQVDDRERVWHSLKAAERIRTYLQSIVDNGQLAARRAMSPR